MASWLRCRFTARPEYLSGLRDCLDHRDSPGFDPGLCFVPSRPARFPKGSHRRLPCLDVRSARQERSLAHPCPCGCISPTTPRCASIAERHLSIGMHEPCPPRPHRISTGRPVSQSVAIAPDLATMGRQQHGRENRIGTIAAPERRSWHVCRDCAQGRLSAPSRDRMARRRSGIDESR